MSENTPNIISGVFAYVKVSEPTPKYQSDDKEFSIDVIVDKATFKAFGKKYPKQKGKTVDNDDFKEIYKIDPPFEDQDEQCILKLKKPAQYKDGEPLPKAYWPKVLVKSGDNKAVPLAEGKLVANGSKGKVSFDVTENSYGTFAKLKAVLVEELIEYKKQGADAGADFGVEVDYGAEEFEQATAQAFIDAVRELVDYGAEEFEQATPKVPEETKAPAKKVSKPKVNVPVEEFDDSDLPF